MKKPIEELDIDFDNTINNLYVVYDSTTNLEVAAPFPLINDVAAVLAFQNLLSEKKDKPIFSKYVLKTIGVYDIQRHGLIDGTGYDILSDDEDVDAYVNSLVELVKSKE